MDTDVRVKISPLATLQALFCVRLIDVFTVEDRDNKDARVRLAAKYFGAARLTRLNSPFALSDNGAGNRRDEI